MNWHEVTMAGYKLYGAKSVNEEDHYSNNSAKELADSGS